MKTGIEYMCVVLAVWTFTVATAGPPEETTPRVGDGTPAVPFIDNEVGSLPPDEEDEVASEETICNTNDLQDITCKNAGKLCATSAQYTAGTAVVRIKFVWKKASGETFLRSASGFSLVPPGPFRNDLILTNRHVVEFPAGAVILKGEVEFLAEYQPNCACGRAAGPYPAACGGGTPNCMPPRTPCVGVKRPIGCWVFPTDCDWALVKIGGGGAPPGVTPATLGADPALDASVFIPQHPQGRCKEIDVNKVTVINADWEFRHTVDTEAGSSGSPVFSNVATPTVVGIHYQGGCQVFPPKMNNGANKISVVIAGLPAKILEIDSGSCTQYKMLQTCADAVVLPDNNADDDTPLTSVDATGDCIPTVSEWGLVVMAMLVLTAATVVIMRRRAMVRGGS